MNTTTFKNNGLTAVALLLVLPTAYFILISVLKYILGVHAPYDAIEPSLENWGIRESVIGWNINLLILFGPLMAFLLTIFQVLKIDWKVTDEELLFHFSVQKRWFPLLVALFSAGVMGILFLYALGENCNG